MSKFGETTECRREWSCPAAANPLGADHIIQHNCTLLMSYPSLICSTIIVKASKGGIKRNCSTQVLIALELVLWHGSSVLCCPTLRMTVCWNPDWSGNSRSILAFPRMLKSFGGFCHFGSNFVLQRKQREHMDFENEMHALNMIGLSFCRREIALFTKTLHHYPCLVLPPGVVVSLLCLSTSVIMI